jgi:predicted dehydrogenase
LWASQVAIGHLNSHRLRVYGESGSIHWFQERPEELLVVEQGQAPHSVRRGDPGTPTSSVALPGGHPEGFIEAFSQLYTDFAERVTARLEKRSPKAAALFAPDAATGARVMGFIEAVLKSGKANSAWTKI